MASVSQGALFGLGNPLLDISANVDDEFLQKYKLNPNDATLAKPEHKGLCEEMVQKYKVDYTAGGAVQNSMRVAQWILGGKQNPNRVTFMGCVGNDDFGKKMRESAQASALHVQYMVDEDTPTGTCAVLVTKNGLNRSLCAFLGASEKFNRTYLLNNWSHVENAELYYASGFHLTVSPDSMLTVAKHSFEKKKTFCLNLSAPYICEFFTKPLMDLMPYVDILFGNETEALAFAKSQKWQIDNLAEIAKMIANEIPSQSSKRMVVLTCGSEPAIVARTGSKSIEEFPIKRLSPDQIVDTNGAGDAFVGGFLAQYVQGRDLNSCMKCGVWAASEIIQRSGCTFPPVCTYTD